MRKIYKIVLGMIAFILISAIIIGTLFYNGIILFNNPSDEKYPVKGIDVSAYQGIIDWDIISKQNIDFVFIKATEGSNFVDERFSDNWKSGTKTSLRIGAYHFFSYDSVGSTQAENFIKTVPKIDGMLPPVIDIEFYGDKEKNPPSKVDVQKNLSEMIYLLKAYYGLQPIIYATQKSYELYVSGSFFENDIWIRSVFSAPKMKDNRPYMFWQYTDREKLDGYNGKEKYIDMNVFLGTKQEFNERYK